MEDHLKIKEISYVYAEAFAAGELKHGTIALIEEGTPVIAIAKEHNKEVEKSADRVIYVPEVDDMFASITSVIPMQLLAYHVSNIKVLDVDKPRNLAKSVTVE